MRKVLCKRRPDYCYCALFQLVYTEVVMENSPSSVFVLKVSASDPDVGANGQISYTLHGADADKFHLNHRTGTVMSRTERQRSAAQNPVSERRGCVKPQVNFFLFVLATSRLFVL